MVCVSRHQGAERSRRQEAYYSNDYPNSDRGGERSDFLFVLHLASMGACTTLREYIWRSNPPEKLDTEVQNKNIIEKANHRNKARDQLNGAKKVARSHRRNQSREPGHARMFERKIKDIRLSVDFLRLLGPVHRKRRFASNASELPAGIDTPEISIELAVSWSTVTSCQKSLFHKPPT